MEMYLQRLLDMHMMRANQQVQFIRYRQYKNMKEEKGQGKQYYHYHPMLKWSKNKNARKQMHVHCWFLK